MQVTCINNNGWYYYEGNYFGFVVPGHATETNGPEYGKQYELTSMFIERLGDLCYAVEGYGVIGWESDCFVIGKQEAETVMISAVPDREKPKKNWGVIEGSDDYITQGAQIAGENA